MGNVLHRETLEYVRFVNVATYPDPPWLADPVFDPPELESENSLTWRLDPDDIVRAKTAGELYNDRSFANKDERTTVSVSLKTRFTGQKVWRIPHLNGNRRTLRRGLAEVMLAADVRAKETAQRTEYPQRRFTRGTTARIVDLNDHADVVVVVLNTEGTLQIYRDNGVLNYDVTLRWAGKFGQTIITETRDTESEALDASSGQNPLHAGSAAGDDGFRGASRPDGRARR